MRRATPWVLCLVLAACAGDGDEGFIVASGHVEATEVRVATEVAGPLASVEVEESDRVTAGQVLARESTSCFSPATRNIGPKKACRCWPES